MVEEVDDAAAAAATIASGPSVMRMSLLAT